MIHRDIKPANLILCRRGGVADVIKLLDFGLVKDTDPGVAGLTAEHAIPGTPHYIAPERLLTGKDVDQRSDLYSVGAVGFSLLTGRTVFEGTDSLEVCHHVVATEPPAPSSLIDGPIPPELEALILRCLAKEPADRPASALELMTGLENVASRTPWSQAAANAWWAANAERVRPTHEPVSDADRNLRVDLSALRQQRTS